MADRMQAAEPARAPRFITLHTARAACGLWAPEMRMRMLLLLLVAVVAVACVSSRGIRYESDIRAPKPDSHAIEILESAALTRPYKVIGMVQANAGAKFNTSEPIEALRAEARKLGGDALIDLSQQPIGGGAVAGGTGGYSGHVRDLWTAKVIVWTTPQ